MTLKELKEAINAIDSKYDDEKVLTNDNNYNEYCMGSCTVEVKGLDISLFSTGLFLLLEY